jgi:hypothetical protein
MPWENRLRATRKSLPEIWFVLVRLKLARWRLALHSAMLRANADEACSYDATLRAVRFWGHDGAMEVSFFVNEDALKRLERTASLSRSIPANGLKAEPICAGTNRIIADW